MHFCSVHAKDSPALKPVTDAIRASGTNKPITIDLENNNNNNLNNYNNGSPSEPPSKKRKRESGPQPPAGLLAIAEGLKKNGEGTIIWTQYAKYKKTNIKYFLIKLIY